MPAFSSTDELEILSSALTGQYEVEREIGRGGMGIVYLARDLRLDRMVAIKTLPAHLAGDPVIRERFLREARTAARLSHPSIVPIHRADERDGQVYFVMGFVDGDSLAARLEKGPLSPRDAMPILRDVAGALGYAHKNGVVHRDVKTENILLDIASGRAMVTDFGIAHVAAAAPLTATGQVLGTVYYLSPEQVAGESIDARSDIYALGVVGYAMLSGKFPFDGPLASAVLVAHVTKQALPLSVAAPHVPAILATIIDRCLAKDPAHRFQTCAELDAALTLAQPDAERVTATAPRQSPLVSDTEAQAILGRAAQLDAATGLQRLPIQPKPRDAAADARRSEGFKTSNLREAAIEAGIQPVNMERALAERGLRPQPPAPVKADRRAANIPFELTVRPSRFKGEPSEITYEMVVQGEIPEDDYDLMVSALTHVTAKDGMTGSPASVGRTLTWAGLTDQRRQLSVSVAPRAGRTTIKVTENLKRPISMFYGLIFVPPAALGLIATASELVQGFGNKASAVGLLAGTFSLLGYLIARTAADEYSKKRQTKTRELIEALGAQARELTK